MKMRAEWGPHRGALLAGVALALGMMFGGAAQGANNDLDCTAWDTRDLNQNEMNRCADHDFRVADRQLNAAYRALTAKIMAEQKPLLVGAQRAWIEFRDRECKYEASENEGGSMYPMVYSGCLARLTKQRTKELEELAEQY
jgi:uncharacterized protein YecT (DUF1311 family)